MTEISKELEEKINQLQLFEQNMNALLMQKQQFQAQLIEISSALEELEKSTTAYKIVGNIMALSAPADLKKDLNSKKDIVELRIRTLEKQESGIREKAKRLQSEVLERMKK